MLLSFLSGHRLKALHILKRLGFLGLCMAILTACSTISKYNPFSSVEFPPAKLEVIKPTLNPKIVWKASTGKVKTHVFQPAVLDGVVYTASESGLVQAFDAATGKLRWKSELKNGLVSGVAATADTVVVVAPKGDIIALDTEGKLRWKVNVGNEVLTPPSAGLGVVIIKTGDSRLLALEADTGVKRWSYSRQMPPLTLRSIEGVAIANDWVVAGFPGGKMIGLSLATGTLRWEATVANPRGATEIERISDVIGTPVISLREVCAVAFQGRVGCFDASTGNTVWTREFSTPVGFSVDERYIISPDEKGDVFAFSREGGGNVWKMEALQRRSPSAPVVMGPAVVMSDFEGYLHWVGRDDGQILARLRPDDEPAAGPLLVSDHLLWVQTRSGYLFAISLD